jgi:hypothetical protein
MPLARRWINFLQQKTPGASPGVFYWCVETFFHLDINTILPAQPMRCFLALRLYMTWWNDFIFKFSVFNGKIAEGFQLIGQ